METDVHVGSSIVANNVTGIGRSASTKLIMDMGFVLEGRAEAELPEKVLHTRCNLVRKLVTTVYRMQCFRRISSFISCVP